MIGKEIIVIYRFNKIEIDLNQFEIREQGKPIPVEPKVFDLIVYLIKHRARIVSRDELFEQVWDGREVSDTSLSNHIKTARKILGDSGDLQQVIKTVRSRGYHFIVEVTETSNTETEKEGVLTSSILNPTDDSGDSSLNSSNRSLIRKNIVIKLGALLFILIVPIVVWLTLVPAKKDSPSHYLLVVPFSVSSNNIGTWEAFADQVTRELIQNLRKISGVRVVPPPSSFTFKSNKIRSHIREQLPDVNYVLDGVISEGTDGNLRITVELEDIYGDTLVWDGDFDIQVNSANLFSVQADIAASVSTSLQVIILEEEKNILAESPTSSLDAYKHYVQGQHQLSLMTHTSVLKSIDYFSQAIALDPKFEAAYIAKSNAYRVIMTFFEKPKDVLPKVISSAIDVLTINPESAQIQSSLGLAYVHAWLWEDAWNMLSSARKRDENLALTELGFALYYSAIGDVEGVKNALVKADQLDPLNEEIAEWGMWALMMVNEIDAALKWGEQKMQLHPNLPYPLLSSAVAEYINGNFDKSISLALKGVELSQRGSFPLIILAQAYAAAGKFDIVQSLISEAEMNNEYMCPYETASIYALMGVPDKVFALLSEAVEYHSNCLIFSKNDPRFEAVRSDPRYLELLKTIGLDDDAISQYPR